MILGYFRRGNAGFHSFFDRIDDIEIERFAAGTGFFGAVEGSDDLDSGGQGFHQVFDGEGR